MKSLRREIELDYNDLEAKKTVTIEEATNAILEEVKEEEVRGMLSLILSEHLGSTARDAVLEMYDELME